MIQGFENLTCFLFLAGPVNDFYSYKINKKSLVQTEKCRFSRNLSSKSKKKHIFKKFQRPIIHISTLFLENRFVNKKVFFGDDPLNQKSPQF